jgi:hypothetical protein
MRPLHLKLAAGVLSVAAVLLIITSSGRDDRAVDVQSAPTAATKSRTAARKTLAAIPTGAPAPAAAPRPPRPGRGPGKLAGAANHDSPGPDPQDEAMSADGGAADKVANGELAATPSGRIRAVQLADGVRFPTAIIAQTDPALQDNLPAPVSSALQQIADDFDRQLAMIAEQANESSAANGEPADVAVVMPSQAVDEARNRADEQYRALFGEAAYLRQGLESGREALENAAGGR